MDPVEALTIRRIAPTDSIPELTRLLHRAYRPLAEMGLRYWATHQSEADTARRVAMGECFVAVLDAELVGTILLKPGSQPSEAAWYRRPDVVSFHQFGIDPSRQRSGIGARLLDVVERRALEMGAAELALDTAEPAEHLIALYTRRGYRIVESVQWPEANYRSVIMSRSLLR